MSPPLINTDLESLAKDPQSDSIPSRSPSLAPTESCLENLTAEEIVTEIKMIGVKVRDYAYEPRPPTTTVIPEFFDPDKALGEHDYRLTNNPRRIPIAGKTCRRLLDIGWVTMAEAKLKWHQMDWEALAKHDSRPAYPWKAKKVVFPNLQQRQALCFHMGAYFAALERATAAQSEASSTPPEPILLDATQSTSPRVEKRSLSDIGEQREGTASPHDSKKRKLDDAPEVSQPSWTRLIPPKQYPAPRAAYSSSIRPLIPDSVVSPSGSCSVEASAPLITAVSMSSNSLPIRRQGLTRAATVNNV